MPYMVPYMVMVKTTVYLSSDLALRLRQLAQSRQRPQAELIREALEKFARGAARPLPPGVGGYRSGRSDVSERADEILTRAAKQRRWR